MNFIYIECNEKCGGCGPDVDTCTSCYDSTRDLDRNCECNHGLYSIDTDGSFPSCANNCPLENCKSCDNNTGNCNTCHDEPLMELGNSCIC